jgi:PTH1 family peptidyl-tRNA hydrolase
MNLSGEALRAYPRRASFTVSRDLLVVVDEVQLPVGRYRFRASGSSGGHNGLKSIEAHLHTRDYGRLRIGVGPPPERARHSALHDYVLDVFGRAEAEAVRALLPELTEGIELWIAEGMLAVMNRFTGKADDRSG